MTNAMWTHGVEWRATATPDPRADERAWLSGDGTVLMEAGHHWDLVSVPRQLGLITLDILWYDPVHTPGPTLVDSAAQRVGFLVPPDPAGHWSGEGVRHVGRGAWVAVPPPHRTARSLEWIVPPDACGSLHQPLLLRLALREAYETLAILTPLGED
ncbi:hypothetical protein [Streptomyces sp. NPDC093261]|uniref:hypothetical protein n=1 Tax=Streptomyces sp. NPDC093261 TaxID=3366037 RepID=UPI003819A55E